MKRFATTAVALALLCTPGAAQAAFPGQNGKIAYLTDQYDLYTINPDGSGATQVPIDHQCGRQGVSWTSDGSLIAISDCSRMAVLAPDGSGFHTLGTGLRMGSWSPDSTRLVYLSCPPSLPYCSIYRINADGTGETDLTNTDAASNAKWSPTGDVIAFAKSDGIYTMTPDGLAQAKIPFTGNGDMPESWSPDGRKLAFTRPEVGGLYDVYITNRDGSGQQQLTSNGHSASASWSPDGTKIVFSKANDLYVMNADGSGQTRLTTNTGAYYNDWQPVPYTGYARPRGATPTQIFLVPAYKPCGAPGNSAHGAPLAFPSCNPPQQASSYLTVGTPDANGQGAKSIARLAYTVRPDNPTTPADETDILIGLSITDVRRRSDLVDYTGQLQQWATIRVTDQDNGTSSSGGGTDPATMVDIPFLENVPCAATADPTIGSRCLLVTTANAVIPGSVKKGDRAIWQLDDIRVYDGGSSGLAGSSDSTLFMDQGIFIP